MPKCDLTGKRRMMTNNVSHANNRTKIWKFPNVQKKRVFVPELGRWLTLHLSTRAIRTIDKIGLLAFLRKQGLVIVE